jgi:hypothetical protein
MKRGPLMALDDGLWDFVVVPERCVEWLVLREADTTLHDSVPKRS